MKNLVRKFVFIGLAFAGSSGFGEFVKGSDEKGEYVIEPQFDYAYDFAENGLALVSVYGKNHYINEKGEIIQPK
jgi:hypothetical protein